MESFFLAGRQKYGSVKNRFTEGHARQAESEFIPDSRDEISAGHVPV